MSFQSFLLRHLVTDTKVSTCLVNTTNQAARIPDHRAKCWLRGGVGGLFPRNV